MAFKLPENVQETTTTAGTDDLILSGAVADAFTFTSQLNAGDTTLYVVSDGVDLEAGLCIFQTSPSTKIQRSSVYFSTNGGAKVNWPTSGTRNVFCGLNGAVVQSFLEPGDNGLLIRTSTNNYSYRTMQEEYGVAISNPGGVGGDPSFRTSQSLLDRISYLETQHGAPGETDVYWAVQIPYNTLTIIINVVNYTGTAWAMTRDTSTPPTYPGDFTQGHWSDEPTKTLLSSTPETWRFYQWDSVNLVREVLDINDISGILVIPDLQVIDTTPDDVTFNSVSNVAVSTALESNSVLISGMTVSAPITITNGSYSKNNNTFTSASGTIATGDTLKLRQTSSASFSTPTTCTVNIGTATELWTITTAASGDSAGVISIVAATYSELESTATVDIDLRITGKTGSLDVGCRVSTLYDPDYHTAVEGVNYAAITAQVVQWSGTDTTDKTVSISLYNQNSTYNNKGELVIDSGSQFGGATINSSLNATLFEIVGTAASNAWQQAVGGDELVVVKLDDALNNGRLTHTPVGSYGWDEYPLRNGGSLSVTNGFPISTSPDYATTAPRLVIPIEFLATGTHYVWFECASIDNASNSLWMGLDGAITGVMFESANTSGTYTWSNNSTLNTVSLPAAGLHDFYMWAREERITITRMLLTTNASYTPSGSVADSTWSSATVSDNPFNPSLPQGPPPVVDDKTPDPFPFAPVEEAAISTVIVSDIQTIIGINVSTEISATGSGSFRIDGGSYITSGFISNGQTVQVRQTSSASGGTTVSTVITIGTVSHSFNVTTIATGAVSLTPQSTTVTVTASGTTVQNLDIDVSSGDGIFINSGVTNTTITNCRIKSATENGIHGEYIGTLTVSNVDIPGTGKKGIYIYDSDGVSVTDCVIENVDSGVSVWNTGGEITIEDNWFRNIQHRVNYVGNAVRCAYSRGPNISIKRNICINESGVSAPEDVISTYICGGTSTSPYTVSDNKIRGGGPSTSAAGITLGDNGGNYFLCENNILYNSCQVGIGVGGNYTTVRNNSVYSDIDNDRNFTNIGLSWGYTSYTRSITCANDPTSSACDYDNSPLLGLVVESNKVHFWQSPYFAGTWQLQPYYKPPTSYMPNPSGWTTNLFDTTTNPNVSGLTDSVWNTAWDVRPNVLTTP